MTRFPAVGGGDEEPSIASKDRAETFGESDVSLSMDTARVSSESVEIFDGTESSISDSEKTEATSGRRYNSIIPNIGLNQISVSTGSNWSGHEIYLWDSDMNVIDSLQADSPSTYTLEGSMVPGNEYRIGHYNDDSGYSFTAMSNKSAPVSTTAFDVTGSNYLDRILFTGIETVAAGTTGSVHVEWSKPSDVYRWDAASLQSTPDGETVDVYVEADDGSGWTEIAGPIDRGDQIDASPDSQVRFRVELTRADTTNNPTLDAIYRRWVV